MTEVVGQPEELVQPQEGAEGVAADVTQRPTDQDRDVVEQPTEVVSEKDVVDGGDAGDVGDQDITELPTPESTEPVTPETPEPQTPEPVEPITPEVSEPQKREPSSAEAASQQPGEPLPEEEARGIALQIGEEAEQMEAQLRRERDAQLERLVGRGGYQQTEYHYVPLESLGDAVSLQGWLKYALTEDPQSLRSILEQESYRGKGAQARYALARSYDIHVNEHSTVDQIRQAVRQAGGEAALNQFPFGQDYIPLAIEHKKMEAALAGRVAIAKLEAQGYRVTENSEIEKMTQKLMETGLDRQNAHTEAEKAWWLFEQVQAARIPTEGTTSSIPLTSLSGSEQLPQNIQFGLEGHGGTLSEMAFHGPAAQVIDALWNKYHVKVTESSTVAALEEAVRQAGGAESLGEWPYVPDYFQQAIDYKQMTAASDGRRGLEVLQGRGYVLTDQSPKETVVQELMATGLDQGGATAEAEKAFWLFDQVHKDAKKALSEIEGKGKAAGIEMDEYTTRKELMKDLVDKLGWKDDAETQRYVQRALNLLRLRAIADGTRAISELQEKGFSITPDTSMEEIIEKLKTEQGWQNDERSRDYVQHAIDVVKMRDGDRAFVELREKHVPIDSNSTVESIMAVMTKDHGWQNDERTRQYVEHAIFSATEEEEQRIFQ